MKLNARDVAGYVRAPDPADAGLLLFGEDAMRVADARAAYVRAVAGPEAEADMRLTRFDPGDLRRDPAALIDALKARGFFDGPRVVIVEGAGDALAPVMAAALDAWHSEDARLIVTAGSLPARSKLRKLFEGAKSARAGGIYDIPPSRSDVEEAIRAAGLSPDRDALAALHALSQSLEPGDFRQCLEKLSLYALGASGVSLADVEACAPRSSEADLDDLLTIVADGQADQVGPLLQRLYAQGTVPVTICIMALRHFRTLHRVASAPGGASAGIGALRPPVYGPRRDRLARQAARWGVDRLETAHRQLLEADLSLRSGARVPAEAMIERVLIRLAMLPR